MNVLIVHAHHEPRSFCSAMRLAAEDELRIAGHQVVVSDLYAQHFNPIASALDFESRKNPDYLTYALEQRHAVDTKSLSPDIQREVDNILACDLVILTFPIYWFSVPAILKGWIDRVFVSGLFYGGRRIYDRGGLRGKTALVGCTLGGREHMFGEHAIHGDLNTMLRPLLQGTLGYVGMDVLAPFPAYHVPYVPDDRRREILDAWRAHVRGFRSAERLKLPSMSNYDEVLRPLRDIGATSPSSTR